jgi:uncharacterized membrane protein YvlD (DUF360 family)
MRDQEKYFLDWQDRIQDRSRFYWLGRSIIMWIGGFLAFIIIDYLSVGLSFDNWITAFIVAGLVGLFNTLFWPVLARILLPFMVFTVGIGALLLNGFFIWLAGDL